MVRHGGGGGRLEAAPRRDAGLCGEAGRGQGLGGDRGQAPAASGKLRLRPGAALSAAWLQDDREVNKA